MNGHSESSKDMQIECALGDLLRKDERIKLLSATVQELRCSKNEEIRMIEEEQSRLMELQSQLNEKETSLNHAQQAVDQASRKLKEEKQRFQAEEAARYDKAIETEKKRLGNELQKQVKQNEEATAAKLEQATQQIRQLQQQVSSLSKAKEDAEITLALFRARTKELQDQQKEIESRYKTQDSPLPELEGNLSKIHQALEAIAHAYFGDLPPEDSDIDQLQRILYDSDRIFQFVPLTASNASKYLRVRAAQSVIVKAICHSLWQPFSGSMMSVPPDQISTFFRISKALARQDRRKESLWRYLTLQGLDVGALQHTKDKKVDNQHARPETQHISDVLRVLVPQQKQKDFERDLEHLLTECARFWNNAKRDSCIIEFDSEPPQSCSSDWLSEPCLEFDHVEASTEERRNNVPAWCFPELHFHPSMRNRRSSQDGQSLVIARPSMKPQARRREILRHAVQHVDQGRIHPERDGVDRENRNKASSAINSVHNNAYTSSLMRWIWYFWQNRSRASSVSRG
ncbi:hypothetical protein CNMCM5793_005697 [Aspergillus hiratsukae]|uniref:Uncharacterized protein n=1 Tax=Aspergillus hiratsukae TaxID=1194566 RepID=A0A8H6QB13_9EURO|nr:hypothetical protein CNMCM5793_005697 [Aspergillus hiratsukae]KAF7169796.1 hypothetical protein CNMCM6106_004715 [Aspergillus hiratsukae]